MAQNPDEKSETDEIFWLKATDGVAISANTVSKKKGGWSTSYGNQIVTHGQRMRWCLKIGRRGSDSQYIGVVNNYDYMGCRTCFENQKSKSTNIYTTCIDLLVQKGLIPQITKIWILVQHGKQVIP